MQARDPNALTKEILLALEAVINSRATALKIDPNNGDGERSKSSKSSSSGSQGGASNKVVELTASNFEEKVYNSDDVVLVFFGAPW